MPESAAVLVGEKVFFSFRPDMMRLAGTGRKITSFRMKQKAKPGDWFPLYGYRYRVLDVMPMLVARVVDEFYRLEGFDSPAACAQTIAAIYPDAKANDTGYLHFFAREG